jgi:hypothetical protein
VVLAELAWFLPTGQAVQLPVIRGFTVPGAHGVAVRPTQEKPTMQEEVA